MSAVTAPGIRLNDYEVAVVRLISVGRTDEQIAHQLVLSVQAVESCVLNAYDKTGTTDRAQLALWLLGGS
jgi:DNA-binding NarL/FixJ family response regulator